MSNFQSKATTEAYAKGHAAGLSAYRTGAWFDRCETRSKAYRAGYSDGWAQAHQAAHNLPAFK